METPEESSVAIKSPCALYSKVAQDPSEPSIRAIYPASLRVSMIFAPFEPERPVSNPFAYVHEMVLPALSATESSTPVFEKV